MSKPVLVVMAAGLGSRYGGLKQIEPVGPNGEVIIDYSIFDALKAGFKKVVFILNEDMKEAFREKTGGRIEKLIDTEYVFQRLEDIPEGNCIPKEREKPWGTGHAVLSCRNTIDSPFAVINADDFYGRSSFRLIYDYLENVEEDSNQLYDFCMVGFVLENTLTDYGHVARGVCVVDTDGYLIGINERTMIKRFGRTTKYTEDGQKWVEIPEGSTVSMNMWGFTPGIFKELKSEFHKFLKKEDIYYKTDFLKDEFFLPSVVNTLLKRNRARVKVLKTKEKWRGVTYKEDRPVIKKAISELIKQGVYSENY
jgi:hypothetical protein